MKTSSWKCAEATYFIHGNVGAEGGRRGEEAVEEVGHSGSEVHGIDFLHEALVHVFCASNDQFTEHQRLKTNKAWNIAAFEEQNFTVKFLQLQTENSFTSFVATSQILATIREKKVR